MATVDRTLPLLIPLLLLLPACAPGGGAGSGAATAVTAGAHPANTGFSATRLARIDSVFEALVAEERMAGAVLLVTRDGRPVYRRAFGWADRESRVAMSESSIFRIASQTKALTSVAILMLAEEGKLGINDPVSRFVPSFTGARVAVDSAGSRALVPVRRAVTLRDLLTHTAGISYGTTPPVAADFVAAGLGPASGFAWYTADRDEPICETVDRMGTLPFVSQPGERWVYGYGTDILGCVVERASGLPLDTFIERRITGPLHMRDTHFFLPPEKAGRLATVYTMDGGRLTRAPEGGRGQGHYVEGPRRSFSGGAGLVSTADDYARFLQMLLRGGEIDGVRLLAPATVRLLSTNQVGTLYSPDGEGHSLAFRTNDRAGGGRVESVGSYGWGGAYGSWYLVDPAERLVIVFLVQEVPNSSRHSDRIPMLVYQAMEAGS